MSISMTPAALRALADRVEGLTAASRALEYQAKLSRRQAEKARIARCNTLLEFESRYRTDPEYAAQVDADQAARQAEVNAKMDAAIARARGEV